MNSVLALKSYSEWKQTGGNGVWKFGGNVKPTISTKSFVRKNSEPFMNSLARNSSMNDQSLNALSTDLDQNKMVGKLNCFKFVPLLALSILKVKISCSLCFHAVYLWFLEYAGSGCFVG